jgi:uncharacterized alkaline shock family protein YloU
VTNLLEVARAIREAVARTDGVAGIGSGVFAEAATYGAGGRVRGVVMTADESSVHVEVHIIAEYGGGTPLPELAGRVREAALRILRGFGFRDVRGIDVAVDDLRIEGE